jgi:glycerol uptake facilitator-like aquaporin
MAEFFGVALLIIFGAGSGASATLSTNPAVSSSNKGVRSILLLALFMCQWQTRFLMDDHYIGLLLH